jgi:hypothetical protein
MMFPNLKKLITNCLLSALTLSCAAMDIIGSDRDKTQININGKSHVTFNLLPKAIEVACTPGENSFPGIKLEPVNGNWDFSSYAGIEIGIVNQSNHKGVFFARIDESSWKNNNSEMIGIGAGDTAVLKVFFGYSWNKPGKAIDTSTIKRILIFTKKVKQDFKFRIEFVKPFGSPGEKPLGIVKEVFPEAGVILDASSYPESSIKQNKASIHRENGNFKIKFSAPEAWVSFPAAAKTFWNLSHYNEVHFPVGNIGADTIKICCQVNNSNAKDTFHCVRNITELKPGEHKNIIVSFVSPEIWDGAQKPSGIVFDSAKVNSLKISSLNPGEIIIGNVSASAVKSAKPPQWLGTKPPVPGKWKLTFEDNFDGISLNRQYWNIPDRKASEKDVYPVHVDLAKSWWGSNTVNSSRNAYVEGGMLKIKCERTSKVENAPEELKNYKYVTSLIDSFGRFSQKYGYFEARMKIPVVLGMWPAFWLMPDRGKDAGIWWKRQTTADGGMEFDIMEYLGRYGDYRYNIAMHWDGYKKDHKFIGTENIYFIPDEEGFVTSGLLWEPGKATFYCNGRKVGVFENERIGNVPGHILFTMPVGGWGTNGIVDDDKLPAFFQIDYVRVWQRDDLK